jgi:4-diphosphocytidyl-2-C-methyl-D-erythritol kinase
MYARHVAAAWEILAPAKLNLYLEVLGRRDDGFHELETLMSPICLYDRLVWRPPHPDTPLRFALRHDPSTPLAVQQAAPADERNLVWRAADALATAAGMEPFGEITLTKRIPAQAGLGGGSSDAAATLVLLNGAWSLGYPSSRLEKIAAQLGSDVPFFLAGRSAICRGRGEDVNPLAHLLRLNAVVVCPPEGISTIAAFRELDSQPAPMTQRQDSSRRLETLLQSLQAGALAAAGRWMTNRLQSAAGHLSPWVDRLGMAFASTGCYAHLLTGSGSAYFGIMRSARHARRVASLLSAANLGTVFATSTCR